MGKRIRHERARVRSGCASRWRASRTSSSLVAGALAGFVGAIAFLIAMAIDLALVRNRTNDLRLLAGLIPGGSEQWSILGTTMHLLNGAALGILFTRVQHRLPGRPIVRGLTFAWLENCLLWPLVVLLDRLHPDIRAGRLERFNRPVPFLQELWRHAAYGLALGWLHRHWQASGRFDHDDD